MAGVDGGGFGETTNLGLAFLVGKVMVHPLHESHPHSAIDFADGTPTITVSVPA